MTRKVKMNTARPFLLLLFMAAVTSTSFAGQGDDEKKEEPDCDYITGVETL
jgi:hypothetical protein